MRYRLIGKCYVNLSNNNKTKKDLRFIVENSLESSGAKVPVPKNQNLHENKTNKKKVDGTVKGVDREIFFLQRQKKKTIPIKIRE